MTARYRIEQLKQRRGLGLLAAAILCMSGGVWAQERVMKEELEVSPGKDRIQGAALLDNAMDGREFVIHSSRPLEEGASGRSHLPIVFYEDMLGPLAPNFVAGIPGTGIGLGLWHRRMGGQCSTGGSTRVGAYTRDGFCNYNTGNRTFGAFTSRLQDFSDSTQIELSFDNFREVEFNPTYDLMRVYVLGGTVGAPVLIADLRTSGGWVNDEFDLSAFAGETFRVAFVFDSVDDEINGLRGWWIDNITLRANGFGCDIEQLRAPSIGAEDGYVREPDTVNMIEGPAVSKGTLAQVGDDGKNWQNRAVFSFDTSGIPDDAIITTATLRLTRASMAGNVAPLGNLVLDMGGAIVGSTAALDTFDYDDASANILDAATSFPAPGGNSFTTFAEIDPEHFGAIDIAGTTQVRVRFETTTDGDNAADYINFYTGEAGGNNRPELIVYYELSSCFEFPTFDPCDGPFEATIWSSPAEDGGVGESHWTSEVGGSIGAGSGTATVGDTGARTQQMLFLHFDTSAIPADATITSAELRLYRSSAIGTPATSLGDLVVDMRNPYTGDAFFGSAEALEAADFQSFAQFQSVATLTVPATNTYTTTFLDSTGMQAINKGGNTQMRVRFTLPDDGDFLADQVSFGTGNFGATSPGRPRLVLTYMTPCP